MNDKFASSTRVDGSPRTRGSAISIEAGQLSLSAGRLADARCVFEALLSHDENPEAHEGLGWVAVWQGDVTGAIASFEAAHRLFLDRTDLRGAGRVALWLAYSHGSIRGESVVAGGWVERANRLLDDLTPGPEHVWLAVVTAAGRRRGDTAETRRLLRTATEIARQAARPDLEAMGLASEGLVLVADGEVRDGMRLLDEAATAAIASDSSDFAAVGHTCCTILAACELIGDIERARQWSERITAYASRYRFCPLYATCRASYAGVLIWCGRWAEAEAELLRAEREFVADRPTERGQAVIRLADLRRRQGRFAEAAGLFAQVAGSRAALLGSAVLALDLGDAARARDLADRHLRQTPPTHRAERAVALELLVSACVELGEHEATEHALRQLEAIANITPHEPQLARASRAAGKVAETRGLLGEARDHFEDALDLFSRCEAPFEAAWVRLDLARALQEIGRFKAASDEAQSARAVFEQLGANHGLELAVRLLAGLEDASENGAAPSPLAGLTGREREVLRLLASGLTDRQVANRLVISEHTVHRHVTNLFRKLAVSSRAAATNFAHRNGLA